MNIRTLERIVQQVLNKKITDYGVGKQIATFTGLSAGAVSTILNKGEIGPRSERAIVENYEAWLEGRAGLPNVLEGIEDDEKPAFTPVGLVRDTTSGRVIEANKVNPQLVGHVEAKDKGTDEDIIGRISKRFDVVDQMVDGMVESIIRSVIVSGAPGVGKTFNIERRLSYYEKDFNLKIVRLKGGASAIGLYQALWNTKDGGIILVDDCDSLLDDEQSLNLLKVALDSTERRIVGWAKSASWVFNPDLCSDEEQDKFLDKGMIPNTFEYKGQLVYITNRDFAGQIEGGSKMAPHYAALMSRSVYVDLTLHTIRQRMVWMRHIFMSEMYSAKGLSREMAEEIMEFVAANAGRFYDLSLRMVGQLSDFRRIGPNWKEIAEVTKMK